MSKQSNGARSPNLPKSEENIGLVGDGYDVERLLTACEVGSLLQVPWKSVYTLPIRQVRLSSRRIRWRPADVREFIQRRTRTE